MATAVPQHKERVLVIEPSGAFGEQLRNMLAAAGYSASLIKNGTEALKAVYDTLPHLVIMDVDLDEVDSYDLLARKQSEKMLAKIPVFLISRTAVPINVGKIPKESPVEFIASMHTSPAEIILKVNRRLHHEGATGQAGATGHSGQRSVPKKILWVEDDRLIGTILSKKLIASGFELFHAKNGEEALDMLTSVLPDGIILDLVLPGKSGFDILQTIQKDPALARVPVMILSNLSKQSDIERAKTLGAQKFLVKASVSLDEIVREVRLLCR